MANDNGDETNGHADEHKNQVVLTLTLEPWHLEVGGHVANLPLYRLMLLEALRVIETQLRLQDAAAVGQQIRDAAGVNEILRRTSHGR
jgi:hypothetical protein